MRVPFTIYCRHYADHKTPRFKSALIGERTKAGMQRAREQGKRVHRPPLPEKTKREIAKLRKQVVSIKSISRELEIAYATAHKYVKALQE